LDVASQLQAVAVNSPVSDYTIPDLALPRGDLWVFGYGSVMWRPGFDYMERRPGRLHGYHRALCVWSWFHRGSPNSPGLVLGLDVGGSCNGIAYRVDASDKHAAADYLYRRELVTDGYEAMLVRVYLNDGPVTAAVTAPVTAPVTALCFRANRQHPQYAGKLDHGHAADVVHQSKGNSGANSDYVASAVEQLQGMGINDRALANINRLVAEGS